MIVTYLLVHHCPEECDRQGEQVTYRPEVRDGVEFHAAPRCARTGAELEQLERAVVD